MAAETAQQRAERMRMYVGRRVEVVMARHDSYEDAGDDRFVGFVVTLALREKGNAGWRGPQYDMVLETETGRDRRVARTFALSRIKEIREIDEP